MNRIRFIFEKRGFACFVRHVELPQLFGRIARRAGLRVGLTQGMSPHPHIVMGPALPVGVISLYETAEIWFETTVTPPEAEYGDVEETDEVSGITVTYKALYVSNPDGSKSALTEFTLTPIEGWDALENTQSPATLDPTKPMYNILGMPVEPGYKGIVVQGGRKFVVL